VTSQRSFDVGLPPGVFLTVAEAASACRVHEATIERAAEAHRFPNAYHRAKDGAWLVPVGDLSAAGFPVSPFGGRTPVAAGREENDATPDLQAELAEWRRRAEKAEALAEERARTIEQLKRALGS
jgi:hypothetical protein